MCSSSGMRRSRPDGDVELEALRRDPAEVASLVGLRRGPQHDAAARSPALEGPDVELRRPARARTRRPPEWRLRPWADDSLGTDARPASVAPGLAPPWWLEEALSAEGGGSGGASCSRARTRSTSRSSAAVTRASGRRSPCSERDPSLRIAILEKEIVGWGPSGRNGGVLHGYWTHLSRLRDLVGDARALELARASDRIVPAIRAFAEARGADIWLREAGYLKVSAAPAQDAAVERAVATARDLGVGDECVPLNAAEVSERLRSPVFRSGAFFRDGATVQPARLVRALRRAVLTEGIALHERTPVVRFSDGPLSTLETPNGRLRAPEIVVATNAWAAGWKPVAGTLTNFGSYVVLTEPVPELIEEIGWTGGEAVTDGRMFVHYFRTTDDGRVLMGSGSGPIGFGGRIDRRFSTDRRDRSAGRGRTAAAPSRSRRVLASRRRGEVRSMSRPTTFPSTAPFPAHAPTTVSATPAVGLERAGWAVRSWLPS